MNKEFNEILEQLGFYFNPDNILKHQYVSKSDLMELLEKAFNLGLDVAADNAEADHTILSEDAEYLFGQMLSGQDYEVYVLKESILQHKL